MTYVVCSAAEAFCREYTSGADPWCMIWPHAAALAPPEMLSSEKLPGRLVWSWRVLRDLLLTPQCCFSCKNSRAGNTAVTHRGLARTASTLYPCSGQADLAGEISGEFIYLFLFYCLRKMAWKLKELIISLSILFFSFSTWLDLALIAHLFIGFKWCTAVNYCPSR